MTRGGASSVTWQQVSNELISLCIMRGDMHPQHYVGTEHIPFVSHMVPLGDSDLCYL